MESQIQLHALMQRLSKMELKAIKLLEANKNYL
jgi:hypothetical protein